MFNSYKLKRDIKKANLEYQKYAIDAALKTLKGAVTSNVIQPDEDEAQWVKYGQSDVGRLGEEEYEDMWDSVYKLWDKNLHARAIIRTMVKFVIGKGAIIRFKDENGEVKDVWDSFKKEDPNPVPGTWKKNKWNFKEKELFTRLFRDGEAIIRIFRGGVDENGLVKIRFIRPSRIKTPTKKTDYRAGETVTYGIGHDPEDVETYKHYYLCDNKGDLKATIPAEDILHYKIFADSDVKRGISLLKVCAPMLKKYEDWLEDRITLNKIRTAVALIRRVDSTVPTVQKLRDSLESETQSTERKKMKMFERGTIITASKGIEYDMVSPNIHAQDVAADGRSMLLSIAAAEGFPEMILTADYSNANYSSTMVAQNPFVREIEDWQDFSVTIYQDIVGIVLENAIRYGQLPQGTSTECEVGFAPMIHSDLKAEDEAYEIEHRNGVLSKKSWQLKRGLDPDTEKMNIEQEQGEEVYKAPPPAIPGQPPPQQQPPLEEGFTEDDVIAGS